MTLMPTPPRLLIVWHSRTGASAAMARAACEGAGDAGWLVEAQDATAEMLIAAGGYIFCCPENLGTVSGQMKEMFDQAYYAVLGRIEGRAYATLIAAGSDGEGARRQIDRIVTGWRLRRVADPLIVNLGAQSPQAIAAAKQVPARALSQCRDIGAALAEGLRLGLF